MSWFTTRLLYHQHTEHKGVFLAQFSLKSELKVIYLCFFHASAGLLKYAEPCAVSHSSLDRSCAPAWWFPYHTIPYVFTDPLFLDCLPAYWDCLPHFAFLMRSTLKVIVSGRPSGIVLKAPKCLIFICKWHIIQCHICLNFCYSFYPMSFGILFWVCEVCHTVGRKADD